MQQQKHAHTWRSTPLSCVPLPSSPGSLPLLFPSDQPHHSPHTLGDLYDALVQCPSPPVGLLNSLSGHVPNLRAMKQVKAAVEGVLQRSLEVVDLLSGAGVPLHLVTDGGLTLGQSHLMLWRFSASFPSSSSSSSSLSSSSFAPLPFLPECFYAFPDEYARFVCLMQQWCKEMSQVIILNFNANLLHSLEGKSKRTFPNHYAILLSVNPEEESAICLDMAPHIYGRTWTTSLRTLFCSMCDIDSRSHQPRGFLLLHTPASPALQPSSLFPSPLGMRLLLSRDVESLVSDRCVGLVGLVCAVNCLCHTESASPTSLQDLFQTCTLPLQFLSSPVSTSCSLPLLASILGSYAHAKGLPLSATHL
eukprot:CAMPEP_0177657702 /NCGR_PEP_ID=MMETSP0447-20121125/16353_1 /TAXON_ID=0 /ORGANISM="Stygamoeba regulata, Strain BSH-02190019" /LENGTH=361 /DNA_ID=CAMNT_0019162129 /DNA_START=96 /DNA_END=1179 /DNA_ORIENTATION=-